MVDVFAKKTDESPVELITICCVNAMQLEFQQCSG